MTVAIMMTIEASLIPFPSEIPMLAVGIQSSLGTMHPLVGLLYALAGVWLGTTINYLIGYYVGDVCIERYGKYFLIKPAGYHKAQKLFREDADFYTFFGRLIPVVRQLISIPAGMTHMPYLRFICLSLSGSAIWLSILIACGYFIGENTALIHTYLTQIAGLFA
jgi:membrane protein DedA with SNARE-associated domain